jgi:tetratricopeptide (TPR) repeat protein
MNPKKKLILFMVLVGLAALIALLPCLWNGFTNWDDQELVTGNPQLGSLSPGNILKIFTRPHAGPYIPLTILSFTVEYQFFRLNPFPYHLTNLLLHVANVMLVFLLMYGLFGNLYAAAAAALIFGLHPLRVESVAWITERKDVLCGFFYLGAILAYFKYLKSRKHASYLAVLILYLLAVLAKPMAITLPAALLLLDYVREGLVKRREFIEKIPFLIVVVPVIIINYFTQILKTDTQSFNLLHSILISSRNIVFYLFKTIFPVKLSALYPYPNQGLNPIPAFFYICPFLMLIAGFFLVWSARRTRHLIFGALFFLVTILPVSQIIPVAGPAIAADRYTYLPSLGISYLLGLAGLWLWRRYLGKNRLGQTLCAVFIGSVLLIMASASALRCRDWKDSLTLWNDVLHKYPNNSAALNNRGRAYILLNQTDRAIEDFDRAIAADPRYDLPYYNRGVAFDKLKEYDRAIADFDRTLALNPDLAVAYEGRGAAYSHKDDQLRALEDFDRALRLDPSLDVAYIDRGLAYFKLGQYDRALQEYDRALEHDPFFAETYLHRGDVRIRRGELDQAVADYTKALALQPNYPDAYYNRAVAYKNLGEPDKALVDYGEAIALKPDFAEAYNNRGNLLLSREEYELALADYDRALRFKPDYAEAYYNRAAALYTVEEYTRAWKDLNRAEKLGFPVDPEFKELLSRHITGP